MSRKPKRYVICPACGRTGISPSALPSHLRGSGCIKKHKPAEIAVLTKAALTDPQPWLDALKVLEDRLAAAKAARKKTRAKHERANYDFIIKSIELRIEAHQRVGPERYEIPRDED